MRCSHVVEDKRLLRVGIARRRAARSAAERAAAGERIAAHGLAAAQGRRVVAAHVGVGTEPPTRPLLEALIADGVRVVLPVVSGHDLAWGDLQGWSALQQRALGLLEPATTSPDAAAAAAAADLLLLPALAVDRAGHRLGRGGGYYDRWLAHAVGSAAGGALVAVVYDDEVVDALPHEAHDRPVEAALTPAGLIRLQG
jgi:5-formyltetrahydrofolate cyclo-ligase